MRQRGHDQATVSSPHTIATRTWEPLTGQARDEALTRIRDIAGNRIDLLAQAAGIMLELRPADGDHPNYRKYSAGAALLLEVANVERDDEAVQKWVPIGEDRRARWRRLVDRAPETRAPSQADGSGNGLRAGHLQLASKWSSAGGVLRWSEWCRLAAVPT